MTVLFARRDDYSSEKGMALSFDLLESWLEKNPEPAGFKRDGKSIFRELALFYDYHGLPAFKRALVEFMAEIRGNRSRVSFDPNHMVLTAGATSANETLMFCLAEPGEAFLLLSPYYPGYITETALEAAYHEAQQRNLRVKGLFCWVNVRHLLRSDTFEAEMELWKKIVYDVRLNISPGSSCHCSEPGKMLTYLEAIRNPKKHIVKTFAIGNTAILIVPKRDSPATPTPASAAA
nr:1-aminocyclopropane-1-carboxylate synthase [Quercus suber]